MIKCDVCGFEGDKHEKLALYQVVDYCPLAMKGEYVCEDCCRSECDNYARTCWPDYVEVD